MSETATCRARLSKFCLGNGLDIGAGGDPITLSAICLDRPEDDGRRSHVGKHPTHLTGDAPNLYWFKDSVLDYVYSSHCLEDADDTTSWLREWLRVIKPGGNLVLLLPDERTYTGFCKAGGVEPNRAHKHADFSLTYIKNCLTQLGYTQADVVYEHDVPVFGNPYSFEIVIRKHL